MGELAVEARKIFFPGISKLFLFRTCRKKLRIREKHKAARNRINKVFGLESLEDVELMDKKFDLVGITERFEESLILMSHLLCMPLKRMASVKMKQSTYKVSGPMKLT